MAGETPITDLTGIGDVTRDELVADGIETVEDLLNERRTLSQVARGYSYRAAADLASMYVSPSAIRGIQRDELPFLKLYTLNGGSAETYAGNRVADPFNPTPPTDLAAVYDASNVMGIEARDYTEGAASAENTPNPTAVFERSSDGYEWGRAYIFTEDEPSEELECLDDVELDTASIVRGQLFDVVFPLTDAGSLRGSLDAIDMSAEGVLTVRGDSGPVGVIAEARPPHISAPANDEDIRRIV